MWCINTHLTCFLLSTLRLIKLVISGKTSALIPRALESEQSSGCSGKGRRHTIPDVALMQIAVIKWIMSVQPEIWIMKLTIILHNNKKSFSVCSVWMNIHIWATLVLINSHLNIKETSIAIFKCSTYLLHIQKHPSAGKYKSICLRNKSKFLFQLNKLCLVTSEV